MPKFNQDDVNIRVSVRLSYSVTLGAYGQPITKEIIADHVDELFGNAGGARDFIDGFSVQAVTLDDGTTIVESEE